MVISTGGLPVFYFPDSPKPFSRVALMTNCRTVRSENRTKSTHGLPAVRNGRDKPAARN